MTRPDWPAIENRPATRYGRDEPARESRRRYWAGIARDALVGSLVLFALIVVMSGVPT